MGGIVRSKIRTPTPPLVLMGYRGSCLWRGESGVRRQTNTVCLRFAGYLLFAGRCGGPAAHVLYALWRVKGRVTRPWSRLTILTRWESPSMSVAILSNVL